MNENCNPNSSGKTRYFSMNEISDRNYERYLLIFRKNLCFKGYYARRDVSQKLVNEISDHRYLITKDLLIFCKKKKKKTCVIKVSTLGIILKVFNILEVFGVMKSVKTKWYWKVKKKVLWNKWNENSLGWIDIYFILFLLSFFRSPTHSAILRNTEDT